MMPLVDHCLNKSSEMTTVSNSLEVFDKYIRQEEEKESDEESFHLNLDDDETDTKPGDAAAPTTETEKKSEKSENTADNEDAILDKFDIPIVNNDPIDSKLEDTLLGDEDHKNENGKVEKAVAKLDTNSKDANEDTAELQTNEKLSVEAAGKIADQDAHEFQTDEKLSVEDEDKDADQDLPGLQTDEKLSIEDGDKDEETKNKNTTNHEEETDTTTAIKDEEVTEDEIVIKDEEETEHKSDVQETEHINDVQETENKTESKDAEKETEATIAIEEDKKETTHDKKNGGEENDAATKNEDVEMTNVEKEQDDVKVGDEETVKSDTESELKGTTEECKKDEKMECEDSTEEKNEVPKETQDSHKETSEDPVTNADDDSEDLFDITAVKGMEEDNAANALEVQEQQEAIRRQAVGDDSEDASNDKPDETGDDEEEESSDKPDNTEDDEEEIQEEMEIDEKQDELDIDETTLKAPCDDDKEMTVTDGDSDYSNSCTTERQNSVDEISEVVENSLDASEIGGDSTAPVKLNEFTGQLEGKGDAQNGLLGKSSVDVPSENRSLKRSLPDDDSEESPPKKSKTDEPASPPLTEEEIAERKRIKSLTSLTDFMRKKTYSKLTMADLEEFCLQKVCEAIVHKSDVGDVHHQLKVQEHLIDTMRKEIQQLSKQARDLEIVNKKLTNDLKAAQGTLQKPLQPLKITRSVGLQVKFTPGGDHHYGSKRVKHSNTAAMPAKPAGNVTPTKTPPTRVPPTTPPRQVQTLQPKPATPLLSQALQNTPKRPAANPQTNVPKVVTTKPAENKPTPGVIDLTDEDEKKDKVSRVTPTKAIPLRTNNQTIRTVNTSQGIRLATGPQGKGPMSSVVTTNATPMLYVVSSGQGGVPQKHVLVNFQPNGMLASTMNGSTVSMLPKQGNTIQLKPLSTVKTLQPKVVSKPAPVNKHPAPLPPPPPRGAQDKTLKQVPPKPHLTIRKTDTGIILQWKMPYDLDMYETIASYQLYAYQETSALPSTDMWRRVGDVKALALPMACTLTQFADKNKYYFAVRPVDIHKRIGSFSDPEEISL